MNRNKKRGGFLGLAVIGGLLYGAVEVLWRGKTHWTMLLTGGVCFSALCRLFSSLSERKTALKCVLGSAVITSAEFVCGLIVNVRFKLNVWDYSKNRGNIMGQICPFYSFLWALLCLPISFFTRKKPPSSEKSEKDGIILIPNRR